MRVSEGMDELCFPALNNISVPSRSVRVILEVGPKRRTAPWKTRSADPATTQGHRATRHTERLKQVL